MSMFDIGLSGLRLNNIALSVTAQNTANVNNPAYSRQVVEQSSVFYSGQPVGSGVQVDSIRRVANIAANESLRMAHSSYGYTTAYSFGMNNIETVLGAEGLSVTSGLNDFFAAIDEASLTPESITLRQQIINSAHSLASQFESIINQLDRGQSELSQQFSAQTESLNASIASIGELNAAIKMANAQGQNTSNLQDSMDQQLRGLSELVGANIVRQDDGTVDISLTNGQPLVVGDNVAQLSLTSGSGLYSTGLTMEFAGQSSEVYADLGGTMGAIVNLQKNEYEPLRGSLDDMAVAFADAVNNTLSAGYDLEGNPSSKPLFSYNPADPAATLSITDIQAKELALSADGSVGDGSILTQLSQLANQPLTHGSLDNISIYNAYTQVIGDVGISSVLASTSADTALTTLTEAQTARDNVSGVSSDEEAANLMMYVNAYEANMKVISTANQMFQTVLSAF